VNVYFRVFSPSGQPKTGELDCGGATADDESSAAVTPLPNGGMGVVWQSGKLWQSYSVMGATLSSNGEVLQDGVVVAPASDVFEGYPAAATFGDEAILMTWKSRTDSVVTGETGVHCALLDPSTLKSLGEWDVGFDTGGSYPFYAPVRAGTWGRGLIAWHSCSQPADGGGVWVRRFYLDKQWLDCQPTALGGALAEGEGCRRMPAVAAFEDGRFLVAWDTDLKQEQGTSKTRVMMQFVR
jgi:hypothetical protein